MMAGNILVFLYSVSYTGFGIVSVLLMGFLYVRIRPKFCFIEKILACLVLPVCLALSFVAPFYLYHPWLGYYVQQLNFKLNTRIYLAEQFLRSEYHSLFGADISRIVRSSMTMDNSYVWGYINYGLVMFTLIMLGYFALLFYDTHKQRTRELVILVCFLGAGWTEPLLFNTSFKNVTLVFLGSFLFLQKEGAKEYCLFPKLRRTVDIPGGRLPDAAMTAVRSVWDSCKVKILCIAAVGGLLGLIVCAVLYTVPEGYVVRRFYTDATEKTSVYLASEDDPEYEGWKVMNYLAADDPMQLVQGKAVALETVRYYLGSAMIGGFLGGAACVLYGCHKKNQSDMAVG
ncbi:MAG: hypothetical protein NC416_05660, partial [Eubacterium sp.]|nr:hypothetical protein [Eubacterium sp.]